MRPHPLSCSDPCMHPVLHGTVRVLRSILGGAADPCAGTDCHEGLIDTRPVVGVPTNPSRRPWVPFGGRRGGRAPRAGQLLVNPCSRSAHAVHFSGRSAVHPGIRPRAGRRRRGGIWADPLLLAADDVPRRKTTGQRCSASRVVGQELSDQLGTGSRSSAYWS